MNLPFKIIKNLIIKSAVISISAALCFCASVLASPSNNSNNNITKNNEKLKQVQLSIKQQREALDKQISKKSNLEDSFKSAELKVAEIAIQLTQTNNQLDDVNDKISKLKQEQHKLNKEKKIQQTLLASMVKIAYLNGKHDYTKLLLNQNEPAQLERLITYYKSINDARVKQLEDIQRVLTRLSEIDQELVQQQIDLLALQKHQKDERQQLALSQKERKSALRQLNKNIKSDQDKLKQLQANQQRLTNAIAAAQSKMAVDPAKLAGLYTLKKLVWPTKGRLKSKFGQRRNGALRWKGVMIDSALGNRVNSIAEGIILYADWLKGFGWVTVIDHGKGYMSLYGHNQALLKRAGDYVEPNEPIALVGQSGGQAEAGLYFEIRYKGKTVNPARWCR
ncbi:peptidoglycan DD-metalloendopeptidase family protein [Psychrosphaera aquimarina]|uniref:Peptidoglycan DD-metalloendopeptidase family protein n=1 Tax=Psychrosphaera aquimarina TaxID=2044854 RepID=A0ABU3R1N1_9GAMM|nr:peptidoglycan DD-metalloendopeptidase family protein [Psychrosphaera aquimarina]MDU0113596.1 peptidoglycan DD-metalloendopeptidase family protein [Psychrosphaera aquimarina]